ncbi:Ureidoglycolate hydrolase [Amylibacter kogurei]|uniref:Ureidoglycolate hydrolase n=1 Tax=Paramylibacter kogurei TaxID=1889778 RepID=A0A2G5K6S7_9RHOB|nr:ureidoglycolate lyase [Amylibacter kogurei]PIB24703.1 Ureidoglycolate hydrolase [Amylibacter kogurei]
MIKIQTKPLTSRAFAPFGDVIETGSVDPKIINQGNCERFNDLAKMDFTDGRAGISLFSAKPRSLPYTLDLLERHPHGSQAFIPMSQHPFLVIVAHDDGGKPSDVHAFVTDIGQGINLHRNTWHGVLTPLHEPGLFCVIDRIGSGNNLQEYPLPTPIIVA